MQRFKKNEPNGLVLHPETQTKSCSAEFASITTGTQDTNNQDKTEEKVEQIPYSKILKMNSPEWPIMIVAAIFAMATGAIQPMQALLFANILGLYGKYNCALNPHIQETDGLFTSSILPGLPEINATLTKTENAGCNYDSFDQKITFYSAMFCALAVAILIGYFVSITLSGVSGEKLTTRLRKLSFQKLLQLEVGYFDDPLNSTGALTTRLSTDASKVQGATGARINVIFQTIGALVCGFFIAFYYIWELTLVCLAFVPIIAVTIGVKIAIFTGSVLEKEQEAMENAGKICTEA